MRKQDFDQLMNQARTRLPGYSDQALRAELFDVLDEFFFESSIWRNNMSFTVNPAPAAPGSPTFDYPLTPSDGGQIIRLIGVVDPNGFPWAAIMPVLGTVHLRDLPNIPQTFTATVVENVVLPTSREMVPVCPDWVLPMWHRIALDGLLGKMMSSPSKPYSNDAQGLYHLRRFREGCQRARSAALRANTFGTQTWRFPQDGVGKSSQRGGVSVGANTGFQF